MGSRLSALELFAALASQVGELGNTMKMFAAVSALVLITLASGHPLATQQDVETSIAAVRDLEETAFAAESRDAKAFVGSAIEEVRDLEEPEFSAKERNAKISLERREI